MVGVPGWVPPEPVVGDTPEERWLCGREEPATLARFVSMVQRAHDAGKAVGRG